jgi:hypothetical protein
MSAQIIPMTPAAFLSAGPPPPHARLFDFESDFVASLRCIPMAVRFKLDRVLIKLTLRQWSRFTLDDRERLLRRPCETDLEIEIYRAVLTELVIVRAGEDTRALPPLADTPWTQTERTAEAVVHFAQSIGIAAPTDAEWAALTELERFVLVKLSRDNHDNLNFLPAMREFGLGG